MLVSKVPALPWVMRETTLVSSGGIVAQSPGPRVRFDAWAHHPYSDLGFGPTQRVHYPNVNLTQLPRFEKDLDKWFHRKGVPIWITEYGFETKPAEPKGVTFAQQAAYARQAIAIAKKDDRVQMFIWFILRDDPTSTWQSGLLDESGSRKPAFATFTASARQVDFRSPVVLIKAKRSNPTIRVPVWDLLVRDGVGAQLGATIKTYYGRRNIAVSQPTSTIALDGYASFVVPLKKPPAEAVYTVSISINDRNGNRIYRSATLVAR